MVLLIASEDPAETEPPAATGQGFRDATRKASWQENGLEEDLEALKHSLNSNDASEAAAAAEAAATSDASAGPPAHVVLSGRLLYDSRRRALLFSHEFEETSRALSQQQHAAFVASQPPPDPRLQAIGTPSHRSKSGAASFRRLASQGSLRPTRRSEFDLLPRHKSPVPSSRPQTSQGVDIGLGVPADGLAPFPGATAPADPARAAFSPGSDKISPASPPWSRPQTSSAADAIVHSVSLGSMPWPRAHAASSAVGAPVFASPMYDRVGRLAPTRGGMSTPGLGLGWGGDANRLDSATTLGGRMMSNSGGGMRRAISSQSLSRGGHAEGADEGLVAIGASISSLMASLAAEQMELEDLEEQLAKRRAAADRAHARTPPVVPGHEPAHARGGRLGAARTGLRGGSRRAALPAAPSRTRRLALSRALGPSPHDELVQPTAPPSRAVSFRGLGEGAQREGLDDTRFAGGGGDGGDGGGGGVSGESAVLGGASGIGIGRGVGGVTGKAMLRTDPLPIHDAVHEAHHALLVEGLSPPRRRPSTFEDPHIVGSRVPYTSILRRSPTIKRQPTNEGTVRACGCVRRCPPRAHPVVDLRPASSIPNPWPSPPPCSLRLFPLCALDSSPPTTRHPLCCSSFTLRAAQSALPASSVRTSSPATGR